MCPNFFLMQQNTRILEYLYMTYRYEVYFEFFMHLHVMNTENNNKIITIIMIIAVGINWRTVFMSIICKSYISRMMDISNIFT